jgi:tetratricopeptide (TPR) repeat protein
VGRRLAEQAIDGGGDEGEARVGALLAAGILAGEAGDQAMARRRTTDALELARGLGDKRSILRGASNLGTIALYDGDAADAVELYTEALELATETGNGWSVNLLMHNLASAYEALGDVDRSRELLRETIPGAREIGDAAHLSTVLRTLARMLLQQGGDEREALALLRESLVISFELDERPGIVECLESIAGAVGRRGDRDTSALLIGAAETVRVAAGSVRHADEALWALEVIAELRTALGEDAYEAAVDRGRRLPTAEAVSRAIEAAV